MSSPTTDAPHQLLLPLRFDSREQERTLLLRWPAACFLSSRKGHAARRCDERNEPGDESALQPVVSPSLHSAAAPPVAQPTMRGVLQCDGAVTRTQSTPRCSRLVPCVQPQHQLQLLQLMRPLCQLTPRQQPLPSRPLFLLYRMLSLPLRQLRLLRYSLACAIAIALRSGCTSQRAPSSSAMHRERSIKHSHKRCNMKRS